MGIFIGVDVGGTFTDFALSIPDEGRLLLHKMASTPEQPDRVIVEGIAALLAEHGLGAGGVERLAHGTTVGTNALIERRCGRVGVVTTAGFRDLLEIGRQTRPRMYDVHHDSPEPLVPRRLRLEIGERVRADGTVHRPLDEAGLSVVAARLAEEEVDCVVVFFLHAYAHPGHERRAAALLREALPETIRVIASADVYPEFREYERLSTTVLNAALTTVMDDYLDRFAGAVRELGVAAEPRVSHSAGGLMSVEMARRFPVRASLSGPAAGVLGAAQRGAAAGYPDLITLDVGGTSTDVSLLRGGVPSEARDRFLAGFPLRMPLLDVNAVGAGGGSVAWIDTDGLLKVGPRSAGARPGPACYGLGGEEATLTDANVVLGRLNPVALLDGRMSIRRDLAEAAVARLGRRLGLETVETAAGIVRVACATIVKAIRTVSVERGHDPGDFALFAFGGAGPLHAGEVGRELGIRRLVVPPHPGILCAEGLLGSDLRADFVGTALLRLADSSAADLEAVRSAVAAAAAAWFASEGVDEGAREAAWSADLRYRGQNYELSVPIADRAFDEAARAQLAADFHRAHDQAYGFAAQRDPIELVSVKVKATGRVTKPELPRAPGGAPGRPCGERRVYFTTSLTAGEWADTATYRRADLVRDQRIRGPAVIEQMDCTIPVDPGSECGVDEWGNLVIDLGRGGDR